ncbi:hypothetical protein PBT90_18940 [Algoriphagus halophytocola]|uniref:Uncharacterized protein n=1 Tax=Algoriphagus halophytocola TaxID=2991499 RepID=A0ABY6MCZ4_9BACT|nr:MULTISPECIES: hypothetical protein [unclassified Algoriphagus]UZD21591.1 hypothetical protein OM944_13070 [Algoriphagus sp. TR-M5]WBL42803.1 hypothetical protein PBT90_18940 [Algoriphagus sp. TR-M9]
MILVFLVLFAVPIVTTAQSTSNKQENDFMQLRKSLQPIVLHHPKDLDEKKYIAFSFEVYYGEKVRVSFSENTPENIKRRKKLSEERIEAILVEKGIEFNEPWRIVYPVFLIWNDKNERTDNLDEELGFLIGGRKYIGQEKIRIERPIVNELLGSAH